MMSQWVSRAQWRGLQYLVDLLLPCFPLQGLKDLHMDLLLFSFGFVPSSGVGLEMAMIATIASESVKAGQASIRTPTEQPVAF